VRLVLDGEAPRAEAVVRFREGEGLEDVPDGVVDAEGGLRPGEEGEEDWVAREEADGGLEFGAEVAWAVGPAGPS
jgi:hypothetical protein